MILSVDPGRAIGWCAFDESGGLVAAGLARKPQLLPVHMRYSVLVIELPHGGKGKASRLNLVTLGRRIEAVCMCVAAERIEEIPAQRWKHQTEKSIMTRRIHDRWMTDADRATFAAAKIPTSLAHNSIDAYGLGRYYFATRGVREIPA